MDEALPDDDAGLSTEAAHARLAVDGPNVLTATSGSAWAPLFALVREPTVALLLVAGGVALLAGARSDALALLVAAGASLVTGALVERRGARAIAALHEQTAPRAAVRRDGQDVEIAASDVVVGDLLLLHEGDRVAADARLVHAEDLAVDTATFTGESVPADVSRGGVVLGGMGVVRGHGRGRVIATGARTELARVGRGLRATPPEAPRDVQLRRLARRLGAVGCALAVFVVAHASWRHGDVAAGVAAGVALAIAILPEELPVVRSILLATSALRLARKGVLVRRLAALDVLDAVDVLAVDKTGTLTGGRMCAVGAWTPSTGHVALVDGASWTELGDVATLLAHASLASEPGTADPTEQAVLAAGSRRGLEGGSLARDWPHRAGHLAHAHAWDTPDGKGVAACKGAPEAVMDLCALSVEARASAEAALGTLTGAGMRVLGVASASRQEAWPRDARGLTWHFLGFVALADPLRPETAGACGDLAALGVRVVMLTGDHADTARAHLRALGLAEHVVTGDRIDALDDAALVAEATRAGGFARVRPEQKLRIVQALQTAGACVGMTGDGVNDAPALAGADAGFAMRGGAEVAREAAPIVLGEAGLKTLVEAVREGRRAAAALEAVLAWLLAVHLPVVVLTVAPLLLDVVPALLPAHVAMFELAADPAAALVFAVAAPFPRLFRPKGRRPGEVDVALLPFVAVRGALLRGMGVLAASALLILAAPSQGDPRTRLVALLVLVPYVLLARVPARRTVVGLLGATLLGLGVVLTWRGAREALHLARPSVTDGLLVLVALGFVALVDGLPVRVQRTRSDASRGSSFHSS